LRGRQKRNQKKSKIVAEGVPEEIFVKKEKKNKKKSELKEKEKNNEIDSLISATQKYVDEKMERKKKKEELRDLEPENEPPKKKKKKDKKENVGETEEASIAEPELGSETSKRKKKKKDKSGISTSTTESGGAETALEPLNQGSGPKIIIAQDAASTTESGKKSKKRDKKKDDGQVHETKGMNKALAYLKVWKEDKASWKFEKCRQIWLLHNCYDNKRINEANFAVLLEYISSVRGAMRDQTRNAAMKKLEQANQKKEVDDDEDEKDEESDEESEDKKENTEESAEVLLPNPVSASDLKRAKLIVDALEEKSDD